MRKVLKKPANNAAYTSDQFDQGKIYGDEDSIYLFKPLFPTFTVDDLHSCPRSPRSHSTLHRYMDDYLLSLQYSQAFLVVFSSSREQRDVKSVRKRWNESSPFSVFSPIFSNILEL